MMGQFEYPLMYLSAAAFAITWRLPLSNINCYTQSAAAIIFGVRLKTKVVYLLD